MPAAFLLESETIVIKNDSFTEETLLSDPEFLVFEALQHQSQLTIQQIVAVLGKKNVLPVIHQLLAHKAVRIQEEIYEQYKPKLVKYVRLAAIHSSGNNLETLLNSLSRAKKQREAVLCYFQLAVAKKPIKAAVLAEKSGVSMAILKSLVGKGIFEWDYLKTDRIQFQGNTVPQKELSIPQRQAYKEIKSNFTTKDVVLLHGITSSGKTEIYVKLIQESISKGKQVLFLLPEIALTTQIIMRLQRYFGAKVVVFHSKYSMNERVEVWNHVLENKEKAQIILGARSSLFLPFSNLGLVVVDEEHESSYKQFEPSPRYNARDAAVVLAKLHQAKLLLGSATPSLESRHNAQEKKYGLVHLNKRFGDVQFPKIELIDIKEKHRKKQMIKHFSDRMLQLITAALENKEQVILFQNRRGYSPVVECNTCGTAPQCPNCDVTLTYHKFKGELKIAIIAITTVRCLRAVALVALLL